MIDRRNLVGDSAGCGTRPENQALQPAISRAMSVEVRQIELDLGFIPFTHPYVFL